MASPTTGMPPLPPPSPPPPHASSPRATPWRPRWLSSPAGGSASGGGGGGGAGVGDGRQPWYSRALSRSVSARTSTSRGNVSSAAADGPYSEGSSFSEGDLDDRFRGGGVWSGWGSSAAATAAGGGGRGGGVCGGGGGGGDATEPEVVVFAPPPPLVKLDVIRAGQLRTLIRVVWAGVAVSVVLCVAVLVAAHHGLIESEFAPDGTPPVPLAVATNGVLQWQNLLWIVVLSATTAWTAALTVMFGVRILRLGAARRTKEQLWVITLLVCTAVAFCPPFVLRLVLERLHDGPEDVGVLTSINGTLGELIAGAYTCCHLFYLWSCCVQYRRQGRHPVYAAMRAGILATIYVVKLGLALRFDLIMTHLPLVSALLSAMLFVKVGTVPLVHGVMLGVMTAVEAVLVAVIASDFVRTHRFLAAQDPMEFRTKRVGFRFFVFHNLLHRLSYLALYVIFFVGLSLQPAILCFQKFGETGAYNRDQSYLFLSVVWYVTVEAYVNLPADSRGLWGWWGGGHRHCDAPDCFARLAANGGGAGKLRGGDGLAFDVWDDTVSDAAVDEATTSDGRDAQGDGASEPPPATLPSPRPPPLVQLAPPSPGVPHVRPFGARGRARLSPPCSCAPAPFAYMSREPAVANPVGFIHPWTFVMERHVALFNFSWLAYSYRRNSHPFDAEAQLAADGFVVLAEVTSAETDTMALVLASDNRVVVTFRGTTSALNVKTNLAVGQLPATSLFPLSSGGGVGASAPSAAATPRPSAAAQNADPASTLRSERLFTADVHAQSRSRSGIRQTPLARARLHTGFAHAYGSVREPLMATLHAHLDQYPSKDVFFTGHSLGGALAGLAAYDLRTSPPPGGGGSGVSRGGMPRGRVAVATFGCPKAGNVAWAAAYNSAVTYHWRVAVAGDIVCGLPKGLGLDHVGQQALLTTGGELVLDPSSFEAHFGGGVAKSWQRHRKRSYLTAIRRWSARYGGGKGYVPGLWPWREGPKGSRQPRSDPVLPTHSGEGA